MTTQKDLKDTFQQNVFSNILFTRYILKSMTKDKSGGSIVFLSSTSALDGNVGRNVYSSSKAAIISQMQVLSREIGNLNVRVNAVAPGLTNTEMLKKYSRKIIKDFENQISLRRIAEPNEIANLIMFLASDLSSYITGQVIRADGGM